MDQNMKIYGVIMAGGEGTRFWPLSRKAQPKQFLNLTGKETMVNETFDRLARVARPEDIFVVTNVLYAEKTYEIMKARIEKNHILAEPAARNTAACIGYAAMEILKKYGDGIMCIMPSDHHIQSEEGYSKTLQSAVALAEERNCLVTIGIKPDYPATGYGYIRNVEVKDENGNLQEYFEVEEFVEKPPRAVAEKYLEEGCYAWNSGMFVWKASVILQYFQKLLPDIYENLDIIGQAMNTEKEQEVKERIYPSISKISIDYGIMERADRVLMLEGKFGWNDVGSLDAISLLHEKDNDGNVCVGKHVLIDTADSICYSSGRMIAAIGVEDLMIVETEDIVMVCPKAKAQEVKRIVEELQNKGCENYL